MKAFQDQVVVITGAGAGIGRATARVFADLGATLELVDIRGDRLQEVGRELEARDTPFHLTEMDVSDEAAMASLSEAVLSRHGRVDVLVNNAGIGIGCEVRDMRLEEWRRIVGVNYWGTVYGIHFFLPSMLERGQGHIVNVASANGLFAFPVEAAYSSTKFAIVGLSEALWAELRHTGVGVTVVCPGLTRTSILDDAVLRSSNEKLDAFFSKSRTVLHRRGVDPMVIARAIPKAVRRRKAMVKVPFHVTVLAWFHWHFPGLYRRVIAWAVEKLRGDR